MRREPEAGEGERIPLGQAILDDIFLLLALGLTVPLIFYIIWGIWDVTQVPLFTPR